MESQTTQGMDKLSLLEALSRANAAGSWVTPWNDPGIILEKTQWIALVPQEDVEGMGRGIGLYADPPETQDMYIPWQWWRPFLQRLKDRLCQGRISTESPKVFDFNYRKRFFHVVDPVDYKGRYLDMEFSLRIEIGRMAASHEDHCVIRFVNAVERAG